MTHPTRLSVNVNKVATLRNARGGDLPSVLQMALLAVDAGADGITVHPRPDERHIRRADVLTLAQHLTVELNIEGYPSDDLLDLVCEVRPAQCTLVPDPPHVLTSNAGWRLDQGTAVVERALQRLRDAGVRASLFLDPDPEQVDRAADLGADRIELYTEAFAAAFPTPRRDEVFAPYRRAAERAAERGLGLNAGHDLSLENLAFFAQHTPHLLEVSIGHALIADALIYGLRDTVRRYLACLGRA